MAKLQVQLVTAEARVLSQEADFVMAPGSDGEFGVLPRHIALLSTLQTGEVVVRNGNDEERLWVSGGFVEVVPPPSDKPDEPTKVIVLADAAERAEDIDESRAEEARRRAQELLSEDESNVEAAAMLESALFRLRVADIRRRRRGERPQQPQ